MNELLLRSVALIEVSGIGPNAQPAAWSGSGVCVHPDGWLVTNAHVAPGFDRQATTIRAIFEPGTEAEYSAPAELVLIHPDQDLALLRCQLPRRPQSMRAVSIAAPERSDTIRLAGFPYGRAAALDGESPALTISEGKVTALRHNGERRLWHIDLGVPAAPGNSGGPAVDEDGCLVGILATAFARSFVRIVPVDYVVELLGEAAVGLEVSPVPDIRRGFRVTVAATGPAKAWKSGQLEQLGGARRRTRLKLNEHGELAATIQQTVENAAVEAGIYRVTTTADDGRTYQRLFTLSESAANLRGTLRLVTLESKKANGWRWDTTAPDPFADLYVNELKLKSTTPAQNQYTM
ncbi:MAG: trypsin-like peptidase domain-containing protein, partial [Planctomycetales bacterium]|nr:trypsin-like peptidase domain-containing protein [Planctomycetales bacterium]